MRTVRVGVSVVGLKDTIRAMEMLGVDVEDMKDLFFDIGERVATDARDAAPVRTGNFRRRIKTSRRKNGALIYVSGTRYARFVEGLEAGRGWPFSNRGVIRPALERNKPWIMNAVRDGLDRLIAKHFGG